MQNKITYIQQDSEYMDTLNYVSQFVGKLKCIPIILAGPPGIGKSLMAEEIAKELNSELKELNGHPGLTREDVEGIAILKDGNSGWINGVVPDAIETANTDGICVLVVNEYNLIRPEIQASTNSLLDYQGRFRLTTNANKLYEVEDGKTLVVIATLNENLEGVFPIQQSVKTRVNWKINLGYPSVALETKVIQMRTGIKKEIAREVCRFANELRSAAIKADATLQRAVSPRELIAFCNTIQVSGIKIEKAFEYSVTNKVAEDSDEIRTINVLVRGARLFDTIKQHLVSTPTSSTTQPQKNYSSTDTIDVKSMNRQYSALLVKKYQNYKVNELPKKVNYNNQNYEVYAKGKWCPLGITIAKILTKRNILQLYRKNSDGSKDVSETYVRFTLI